MALPDELRVQIIAAAASAAGSIADPGYDERLEEAAVKIAIAAGPESKVSRRMEGVLNAKKFVGTLKNLEVEERSTRALVTIQGAPSQYHEDGIEQARTERTDGPAGAAMLEKLRPLVGHRVLFFVEVQTFGQGADARKFRVLVHAEDLGMPREYNPPQNNGYGQAPRQAPQAQSAPWGQQQSAPPPPPQQPQADPWGGGSAAASNGQAFDTPPF